jgi:ATP-binding cassette subfamily F protein uup
VSHDRYFLNRVCNGILAFEGEGYVHFSEGDYDYYIEKRNARLAEAAAQSGVPGSPDGRRTGPPKQRGMELKPRTRKLTWKEAKEVEMIELEILRAEADVERIEAIFSAPDFYEKHGGQTVQLTQDLADAKGKIKRLYARWHELEELRVGNQ